MSEEDEGNVYDFRKWKKIIEAQEKEEEIPPREIENLRSLLIELIGDMAPEYQTFHVPLGNMAHVTGSLDELEASYWIFNPEEDDSDETR